ncbi:hypothetical protein CHLRE_02g142604v5 [Chlamydomonas reinhardtii]|uniref:Uncharacterized protein n=1 Tax=Chlamydomonas reinhardtii TaxID=3055 RepID=A0A2K3E427_CHLRE|nr:uncharacterized protein CHLRE_02g142604v5 [Chlamydomonas reinhardtii]PNW87532.1 hypothetical protein CHLRE_02g142604v5 [Chlamydomonas reinhardtii]
MKSASTKCASAVEVTRRGTGILFVYDRALLYQSMRQPPWVVQEQGVSALYSWKMG